MDVAVVGAGIVGLSTAYELLERFPSKTVVVLEKEEDVARHQTGHNSGVLHSGIYYRPGSSKAVNCREGKRSMEDFCDREGIPYDICGKVIVATDESEVAPLQNIYERGRANGVECELIGPERLREIEPHVNGLQAIHVSETGIVDYGAVSESLVRNIREAGGTVLLDAEVTNIDRNMDRIILETVRGAVEAEYMVNCAGLFSDRIARWSDRAPPAKIVPFRGEYYRLTPSSRHLCRNLIYPVPDPAFPFLGVHFTRTLGGSVECGPNAVLALAREGYEKWNLNPRDAFETLTYSGFLRLALKHWKAGSREMWRSFSKSAFARALQRLVPEIRAEHLEPAPAGVRAQAVRSDGQLVDDFLILESERVVNVCNAPSPAATAALNIGGFITERLARQFR